MIITLKLINDLKFKLKKIYEMMGCRLIEDEIYDINVAYILNQIRYYNAGHDPSLTFRLL